MGGLSTAAWCTRSWSKGTSPAWHYSECVVLTVAVRVLVVVQGQGVARSMHIWPAVQRGGCWPKRMPQSRHDGQGSAGAPDCIFSSSWCSRVTRLISILMALCMLLMCAVTVCVGGGTDGWTGTQAIKRGK